MNSSKSEENQKKIMRYCWIIFFLSLFGFVHTAHSSVGEPHQFSEDECSMCHLDIEQDPASLKLILSSACENCHTDSRQQISHPIDISPGISVPYDMPLEDGMLSCITCHYVHSFSVQDKRSSYSFLRRSGKGPAFCSACHGIDPKEHVFFENVHQDSYQKAHWNSSIDGYTLQCVECHDDKIDMSLSSFGTETWRRFSNSQRNHPVGISFAKIATKSPRKFNPVSTLPKEIRLYNGKIGCGTCHNAYSKEKFMLVENNWRSRLCLECHNK
jgi:predicted CXXCH cytochrome family protein